MIKNTINLSMIRIESKCYKVHKNSLGTLLVYINNAKEIHQKQKELVEVTKFEFTFWNTEILSEIVKWIYLKYQLNISF